MKKILFILPLLLMQTANDLVLAQSKPKAGDVISGVVSDSEGPMMMVNVTERDTADRIVAHTITDIDGRFSFKLVDPKDRLKITYIGYQPFDTVIDRRFFEIKMQEPPAVEMSVYPRDRNMVGRESSYVYMNQIKEYAPTDYICGYIIQDGWGKKLWGVFLLEDKGQYSLLYKKGDKTETRSIDSDLAKELESAVNSNIADIEYAVNNPVTVKVPGGLPLVDIIYDGDVAIVATPDKAAYFWTWGDWPEKMPDGVWKREYLKFMVQ